MFSYAIAQMQGNVLGLKKRLAQLVPHMYGEHDECEVWCTYRRDPENFKVDWHYYHFLAQLIASAAYGVSVINFSFKIKFCMDSFETYLK